MGEALQVEAGLTVVKVGINGGLAVELVQLVLDLLLLLLGKLCVHIHVSLEGLDALPQFRSGARIKLHADRHVSLQLVQASLELAERPLVHRQASLNVTGGSLNIPLQLRKVTGARRQGDRRANVVEPLLKLLLLLLREVRVNLHLGLDLLNLLPKSLQLARLKVNLSLEANVRLRGLLAGLLEGLLVEFHLRIKGEVKVLDLLLDALQILAELTCKLGKVRDDLDGKLTNCSLTGHP